LKLVIVWHLHFQSFCYTVCLFKTWIHVMHIGNDSLLVQTLVKFLNLPLGPSMHFLVKFSFNKNLTKSIEQELALQIWLTSISNRFLILHYPLAVWSPWPACLQQEFCLVSLARSSLTPDVSSFTSIDFHSVPRT
jgi:hypothetical protein